MNKDKILDSRFIKLLGPRVTGPKLWEWSKHNVALGSAIGVTFGLLIPLAQIPLSVIACIIFRANILAASITTLISNPITFAPLYYGAYQLGSLVLGLDINEVDVTVGSSIAGSVSFMDMGKPLYVGLGVTAIPVSIGVYISVRLLWEHIENRRLRRNA